MKKQKITDFFTVIIIAMMRSSLNFIFFFAKVLLGVVGHRLLDFSSFTSSTALQKTGRPDSSTLKMEKST